MEVRRASRMFQIFPRRRNWALTEIWRNIFCKKPRESTTNGFGKYLAFHTIVKTLFEFVLLIIMTIFCLWEPEIMNGKHILVDGIRDDGWGVGICETDLCSMANWRRGVVVRPSPQNYSAMLDEVTLNLLRKCWKHCNYKMQLAFKCGIYFCSFWVQMGCDK